jgi:hydrogenase maturation protease
MVIRGLIKDGARSDAPLFVEAGPLPESASGPLRRYAADLVVFVDAADMHSEPGAIAWLSPDDLTGVSALSHTLPLSALFCFLQQDLGCETAILGIQPTQMEFDTPPSQAVITAVARVVAGIRGAVDQTAD